MSEDKKDYISMNFGALLSPKDDRDYSPSLFYHPDVNKFVNLPKEFTQDHNVYNQGHTGKCVAYTTKSIVEFFNKNQYDKNILMSADFIYSNRSEDEAGYRFREGMFPREALKKLQKFGVCENVLLPPKLGDNSEDIHNHWDVEKLTKPLYNNAFNYRIGTYYSPINNSDIMEGLYNKMGVLFVIPIFYDFQSGYNYTVSENDYKTKDVRGLHAIRCIGWKEHNSKMYWICVNSWGKDWGESGKFYIPFDTYICEKWIIADDTLKHWSDVIFEYLRNIGINIAVSHPNEKCKRGTAFIYLSYALGYDKYDEVYENSWEYCNKNGVEILEKNYTNFITRGESFVILAKLIGWKDNNKTTVKEHWAEKFFVYLNNNGIKLHERRFNDTITVAEFCVLLAKLKGFK